MAALPRPIVRLARQAGQALLLAVPRLRLGLVAVMLGLCLTLSACGGGLLSGNYVQDTATVSQALLSTIALAPEDPGTAESVTQARALINDYMARYRPQASVNGLGSFTTMQTALNSLASHYATTTKRPLPDALRSRVRKELEQAAANASRGA
ncbi:MAG: photosystem II protein Psb27 [Cyanobacteria bacterium K_Offshore_surface_m2_239]|nr:photosystem II protein Psb27 [Cyanobacteria bacterium K_Offshore_surface_m2_239]